MSASDRLLTKGTTANQDAEADLLSSGRSMKRRPVHDRSRTTFVQDRSARAAQIKRRKPMRMLDYARTLLAMTDIEVRPQLHGHVRSH